MNGHKGVRNILLCTQLARFKEDDDEFHVKIAKNLDETCKLLKVDFEYDRHGWSQRLQKTEANAKVVFYASG